MAAMAPASVPSCAGTSSRISALSRWMCVSMNAGKSSFPAASWASRIPAAAPGPTSTTRSPLTTTSTAPACSPVASRTFLSPHMGFRRVRARRLDLRVLAQVSRAEDLPQHDRPQRAQAEIVDLEGPVPDVGVPRGEDQRDRSHGKVCPPGEIYPAVGPDLASDGGDEAEDIK